METRLSVVEISDILASTPAVLRTLLVALPPEVASWHPENGKWRMKEVVGHLVEEDKRDFIGRIRVMLDQNEPPLVINDQDEVARERRDCLKALTDLLNEFDSVRQSSVAEIRALTEEQLRRSGVHPKAGRLQISDLLHEWVYHDLNHLKQISNNAQRLLWTQLGTLRGFYGKHVSGAGCACTQVPNVDRAGSQRGPRKGYAPSNPSLSFI
jgi:hypothetical protein